MKKIFEGLDCAYPGWKKVLDVRENNEGAIGLYKKLGFKQDPWDGNFYANGDKMLKFVK